MDFSSAGKVLSVEQKQFYQKNGFLLVRGCVAKDELKKYENQFNVGFFQKVFRKLSTNISGDLRT